MPLIGSFIILHIHDSFITDAFANSLSYHTTNMLFVCHTEQKQKPCYKDIDFIKLQQNYTNIKTYHENQTLSVQFQASSDIFLSVRMIEFNHFSDIKHTLSVQFQAILVIFLSKND